MLVFIHIWTEIIFFPIRFCVNATLREKIIELTMLSVCKSMEKISNRSFFSFYRRERYNSSLRIDSNCIESTDRVAIILQGPIKKEDDFTLETVRLYHSIPNIDIIVSTWRDQELDYLKKIEQAGAYVVMDDLPDEPGILNVNYQLKSTKNGISKALELGCEFICKTRTDQRIYKKESFLMLVDLIKTFPLDDIKQKGRIIALSSGAESLYMPFYISDFLYFGYTGDIAMLSSIPEDKRNLPRKKVSCKESAKNELIPEMYIIREWIKLYGINYEPTIKGYWRFVKERMILIDKSMINLYWHKYDDRFSEHIRNGMCSVEKGDLLSSNFDFATWLCLYNGQLSYSKEMEKYPKQYV